MTEKFLFTRELFIPPVWSETMAEVKTENIHTEISYKFFLRVYFLEYEHLSQDILVYS